MRVIAGEFRSRKLKSLPGTEIRPTPDRLRESLFNILAPRIEGAVFVDAYAGTGAVGIEAVSRGAAKAVFLEKRREAAQLIRENIVSLGIEDRCQVVQGPVELYLPRYASGIVFVDPPYTKPREYEAVMAVLGDAAPGLAIVQHDARQRLAERYGKLARTRIVRQGDNTLSFYQPGD
jgi:16S rRNA (guanine(966)-N(2))-methyltransferase RsmD